MAAAPGWPGAGPLSYQLVTPGWLRGGTVSVPFELRPSATTLACTLMAGMSRLMGIERVARPPVAACGTAWAAGGWLPCARLACVWAAAQAGGTGGGAQRKVSWPMKAITIP